MSDRGQRFELDVIGALEGTDKSSSFQISWDYLRHYERLFEPWRNEPINVIEIGVETGASLRVWKSFFPKATIVGIDINNDCTRFAEDRIVIEIGSQDDPGHLFRICSKYPPTIFIDDGSHQAHHMIFTLERVFPMLLPGGMYIIEDLAFHFGYSADDAKGKSNVSIQEYLTSISHACMARRILGPEDWGSARYQFENLDWISFIRSAAILKKVGGKDLAGSIGSARAYLRQRGETAEGFSRLAAFILRHGGSLDEAEHAARRAVEIGGEEPHLVITHAEILDRLGKADTALSLLRRASQLHAQREDIWRRRGHPEGRLGHRTEAAAALERAAALRPKDPHIRNELSHAYENDGKLDQALAAARDSADLSRGDPAHDAFSQRVERLQAVMAGPGDH